MHFLESTTAYQDQPSLAIHAAPWPQPGVGEAEDQGERVDRQRQVTAQPGRSLLEIEVKRNTRFRTATILLPNYGIPGRIGRYHPILSLPESSTRSIARR
jgi:hypothetical protein